MSLSCAILSYSKYFFLFSGTPTGVVIGNTGRGVVPVLWIVFAITAVLILISIVMGLVIRSRRWSFNQGHGGNNRRSGNSSMMRTTISSNGVSNFQKVSFIIFPHNTVAAYCYVVPIETKRRGCLIMLISWLPFLYCNRTIFIIHTKLL